MKEISTLLLLIAICGSAALGTTECISREEAEEIARNAGFFPPYELFEKAAEIGTMIEMWHVYKFFEGNETCPEGFEGLLEIGCDGSIRRKEIRPLCLEVREREEYVNCTQDLAKSKAEELLTELLGEAYFRRFFKLENVTSSPSEIEYLPVSVEHTFLYGVTYEIEGETYKFLTHVVVRGSIGGPVRQLIPVTRLEIIGGKLVETTEWRQENVSDCKVMRASGILSPIFPLIGKETAIEIVEKSGLKPEHSKEYPHELKMHYINWSELNGTTFTYEEPRWFIYVGKVNHTISGPGEINHTIGIRNYTWALPSAAIVNPMTGEIEEVTALIRPLGMGLVLPTAPPVGGLRNWIHKDVANVVRDLRIRKTKLVEVGGESYLLLEGSKRVRLFGFIPFDIPVKIMTNDKFYRIEKPWWSAIIEFLSIG